MEILRVFPTAPRLLDCLFIYFDFAFVREPLVSGQVGPWGLKQWIMQAALLPWWPSYAVLVSPAPPLDSFSSHAKTYCICLIKHFSWFLKRGKKDACSAIYWRPKQTMQIITSEKKNPWRSLERKDKHFFNMRKVSAFKKRFEIKISMIYKLILHLDSHLTFGMFSLPKNKKIKKSVPVAAAAITYSKVSPGVAPAHGIQ